MLCCECGNSTKGNDRFCSLSCAAKSNNRNRGWPKKLRLCPVCEVKKVRRGSTYCSADCHRELLYKDYIDRWLRGEEPGGSDSGVSNYVRRHLVETNGDRCMSPDCGWDWSKPCRVEVDHRNGNPLDHTPNNVRLLCPNCHSLTESYKGKNLGSGRAYRRSLTVAKTASSPAYHLRECDDCGKRVCHGSKQCRACFNKNRPTVIDWPPIDTLRQLVEASNTNQVAKSLGVSYSALRKRLRR
jgi:hypothetical protein